MKVTQVLQVFQDLLGCKERLELMVLVYLDQRETEACLDHLDLLGPQGSAQWVQRVQLVKWAHLVHRAYLERESKDKRESRGFRGSLAPEVLQDKVCKGTRVNEGSEVIRAQRGTEDNQERLELLDLWVEWDRRESLDSQRKKSSKLSDPFAAVE